MTSIGSSETDVGVQSASGSDSESGSSSSSVSSKIIQSYANGKVTLKPPSSKKRPSVTFETSSRGEGNLQPARKQLPSDMKINLKLPSSSKRKRSSVISGRNKVRMGSRKYSNLVKKGPPLLSILSLVISLVVTILIVPLAVGLVLLFLKFSSLKDVTNGADEILPKFEEEMKAVSKAYLKPFKAKTILQSSCEEVLRLDPSSPSGYYPLQSGRDKLTNAYCDMTLNCGNITGGWMKVGKLNAFDCPSGFETFKWNGMATCTISGSETGCNSINFNSFGVSFSKVCGRMSGFGFGDFNGFYSERLLFRNEKLLNNYMDGVSITVGSRHIWSLVMGGCSDCNIAPTFVGSDWSCDDVPKCTGYSCERLLWDSSACGNKLPFFKDLSSLTKSKLKIRVCRDTEEERVALDNIELYVHQ